MLHHQNGGHDTLAEFFYKVLFNGLLACAGLMGTILGIIIWRKMWVGGKTFEQLGNEGNVMIFIAALTVVSLVIAWRIKVAQNKLES